MYKDTKKNKIIVKKEKQTSVNLFLVEPLLNIGLGENDKSKIKKGKNKKISDF